MKIYPAIDLMNGKCVRLMQGRFDAVTEYSSDPVAMAERFAAAGATELHVVDLDGARQGAVAQTPIVASLAKKSGLNIQVGGGIRSLETAVKWLELGVKRVVIGSLAAKEPAKTELMIREIGAERITLAVDYRKDAGGVARVLSSGWQEAVKNTVEELISHYYRLGVKHVLCTDVERDGTLLGPDCALYRTWQVRFAEIELQVSGGIGRLEDLKVLRAQGARAVILGKSLYEGKFRLEDALALARGEGLSC